MEDDRAEQLPDGADSVPRIVERPAPQTQTLHVVAHRWRIGHVRGPALVHLLFQRCARSGGRIGRVPAPGLDRWMDDDGHGRVQLHRRRLFGMFKTR